MIEFRQGNIFDSGAEILVNPTNCAGVMGKGLAKEFKRRWPEYYEWYRKECLARSFKPGDVAIYDDPTQIIASAFTKNNWREPSQYQWIERILGIIKYSLNGESIAIPALGCGYGELRWGKVKPMFRIFENVPEKVLVYEPL